MILGPRRVNMNTSVALTDLEEVVETDLEEGEEVADKQMFSVSTSDIHVNHVTLARQPCDFSSLSLSYSQPQLLPPSSSPSSCAQYRHKIIWTISPLPPLVASLLFPSSTLNIPSCYCALLRFRESIFIVNFQISSHLLDNKNFSFAAQGSSISSSFVS